MQRVIHSDSVSNGAPLSGFSGGKLEARYREQGFLEQAADYWSRKLAGRPGLLDLPTDRPRPAQPDGRRGREPFTLPSGPRSRIEKLAGAENATLFTVLLAAVQTLLHRYTGQTDICVGSAMARRPGDSQPANTTVLRGDLSGQPTFRELVRRSRKVVLEGHAQALPYEKLLEALETGPEGSREPLFQAALTVENGMNWRNAPTIDGRPFAGAAECDLYWTVGERGSELAGALEYRTDLFDPQTARRIVGHLVTLLSAAVASPDQPIHALELLTAAERQQALVDWNEIASAFPDQSLGQVAARYERNTSPERPKASRHWALRLADAVKLLGI